MTYDQIGQMTTPDAIRSGDYAKNREAIMASMKQTVVSGAVQIPMRPFPGTQPQPASAPPVQVQPGVPHQQQPFGQQQPTGQPTPPVQNPNIPAQAGMGMPTHGAPHPSNPVPGQDPRALAAAAAANQLANPGHVDMSGVLSQPAPHGEYKAPPAHAAPPPGPAVLQQPGGGNPMIRNT